MSATEADIQHALYLRWGRGRELAMPNIYVFGNESDYLTLTKAGYTDEYEIKTSRADFRADRKKERHEKYQNLTPWHSNGAAHMLDGEWVDYTRITLSTLGRRYPNRFWYVVPEGLIEPNEVPPYAGLIYIRGTATIDWNEPHAVKAPMLHKEKAHDYIRSKMLQAAHFRYLDMWRQNYIDRRKAA